MQEDEERAAGTRALCSFLERANPLAQTEPEDLRVLHEGHNRVAHLWPSPWEQAESAEQM